MSSVLNHALSIRTTKKHIKNQPQQQKQRQQTALALKVAAASLNRLFYHDSKRIRARFFSTNKNKHREAKHNPITKFLNLALESATTKKSEEEQWRARQEMRERAARPKMKKRLLFTMPSLYTDG
jgi:hypothetical protein